METLLNLLKGIAPGLATAVAGPLGGLAITALAEKFGVADDVNAISKAISGDPDAALKLAEIDLRQFELENADRDSARKREIEVAASGNHLAQLVVPILALGTVSLTFMFIGILLFKEISSAQQQLVIFALGYATAAAQQVLSYYFGSSKSSQDKTVAMSKALK